MNLLYMSDDKMENFIEYLTENAGKFGGSAFTYYRYLEDYCDGWSNSLFDMGIEDEIIDHLMDESGASNRNFFEGQDAVTLVRLCDPSWINDFISGIVDDE